MSRRVLMIEDEPSLVLSVGDRLRSEGYAFESAADGETGLRRARTESFDLVLVDVMLPRMGGFEIIRSLRAAGVAIPLLMVTARDQVVDRVSGLRAGADDYVVKPFALDELVARIEVHLRRLSLVVADPPSEETRPAAWLDTNLPDFRFGPFRLSYRTASLSRDGQALSLTYQEFRLLCLLVKHQGEVVDGDTLLSQAWGYESDVGSRTLYVHMSWLRKKLESPENPDGHIRTIRRVGYLFVA